MKLTLKRVQRLNDADLHRLSQGIDRELLRRREIVGEIFDSAQWRSVERESYGCDNGLATLPIRTFGIGRPQQRRAA